MIGLQPISSRVCSRRRIRTRARHRGRPSRAQTTTRTPTLTNAPLRRRRHTRHRRPIGTIRTTCPRHRRRARPISRRQKLRLDQHRDDRTGTKRETPMAQSTQNAADLATVRGDGDPCVVVGREDRVEDALGAGVLGTGSFTRDAVPKLVVLRKAWFNLPSREQIVDIGPVTPMITRVRRDALAEELLDGRDERVVVRQREVGESDVCCAQAAGQGRGVVGLRIGDVLGGDLALPEVVGDLSLGDAVGGQVGVLPGDGAVAC